MSFVEDAFATSLRNAFSNVLPPIFQQIVTWIPRATGSTLLYCLSSK